MERKNFSTVADYIAAQPASVQPLLQQMRSSIAQSAPDATECISYGIPTFKLNGKSLVHFAAFKNHIGFYATPSGHTSFAKELARYKQGKGSVQFPLSEALPLELVQRITAYRVQQLIGSSKPVSQRSQKSKTA